MDSVCFTCLLDRSVRFVCRDSETFFTSDDDVFFCFRLTEAKQTGKRFIKQRPPQTEETSQPVGVRFKGQLIIKKAERDRVRSCPEDSDSFCLFHHVSQIHVTSAPRRGSTPEQ